MAGDITSKMNSCRSVLIVPVVNIYIITVILGSNYGELDKVTLKYHTKQRHMLSNQQHNTESEVFDNAVEVVKLYKILNLLLL